MTFYKWVPKVTLYGELRTNLGEIGNITKNIDIKHRVITSFHKIDVILFYLQNRQKRIKIVTILSRYTLEQLRQY